MPNSPILPDIQYPNPFLDSSLDLVSEFRDRTQFHPTHSKSIEFSDLRRLLELASAESYTEAAYRMQISESHLRRVISKLNEFVGFKLVEKTVDQTSMLTSKAKLWLKSFGEVHNSLSKLNECLANIREVQDKPNIGIGPCIAFTQTVWKYLEERSLETDLNCRAGADLHSLLQGNFDCLIGLQRIKGSELRSRVLYTERLHYYHHKQYHLEEDSSVTPVNIILQQPMTADHDDPLLFTLPTFLGREIRFIEVADVCEALELVNKGKGIFPSLLLNPEIVPPELSVSTFNEHIEVPVYLITSIHSTFDFSHQPSA